MHPQRHVAVMLAALARWLTQFRDHKPEDIIEERALAE